MKSSPKPALSPSALTKAVEKLHECKSRDDLAQWLEKASGLPPHVDLMWGLLQRKNGVWSGDWLQTRNDLPFSKLVSVTERLDRVIRYASAGGGFSLVTLPTSSTDLSAAAGIPRIGVAWAEDFSADRGYLLLVHDANGLNQELRKSVSLLLPQLYWVTRSILTRERRAQQKPLGVNLTPRERELLREVVRGRADREIALESGRSHHTIKNQVRKILHKLGVSRRTQAASIAERNHLIDTTIEPISRWNTSFGD